MEEISATVHWKTSRFFIHTFEILAELTVFPVLHGCIKNKWMLSAGHPQPNAKSSMSIAAVEGENNYNSNLSRKHL